MTLENIVGQNSTPEHRWAIQQHPPTLKVHLYFLVVCVVDAVACVRNIYVLVDVSLPEISKFVRNACHSWIYTLFAELVQTETHDVGRRGVVPSQLCTKGYCLTEAIYWTVLIVVSEPRPLPIIRDGQMNGSCKVLVVLSDVDIASTGLDITAAMFYDNVHRLQNHCCN